MMTYSWLGLSFIMLFLICLAALLVQLDFFILIPKFGAEHFGAPDDIKKMVKNMPDRPMWVNVLGMVLMVLLFAGAAAVLFWAGKDAVWKGLGFAKTALRFIILLDGFKLFDVVCFDWFLMTKIRLPEKVCPQTAGAKGYNSFGFNAKSQITKAVVYALLSLVIAWFLTR